MTALPVSTQGTTPSSLPFPFKTNVKRCRCALAASTINIYGYTVNLTVAVNLRRRQLLGRRPTNDNAEVCSPRDIAMVTSSVHVREGPPWPHCPALGIPFRLAQPGLMQCSITFSPNRAHVPHQGSPTSTSLFALACSAVWVPHTKAKPLTGRGGQFAGGGGFRSLRPRCVTLTNDLAQNINKNDKLDGDGQKGYSKSLNFAIPPAPAGGKRNPATKPRGAEHSPNLSVRHSK